MRRPPRSTLVPDPTLFRSGLVVRDDQGVLDPDPAVAGQVDARLHGDGHAGSQGTRAQRADARRLVDLQAHAVPEPVGEVLADRKSTRLNSSHANISYAVFC